MPADPTPLVAKTPVIPVLTIERAADAVPLARALVAGGLPVVEVTLRTPAAIDAVRAIASAAASGAGVPGLTRNFAPASTATAMSAALVTVPTPTTAADIAVAVDAGAKFL